MRYHVDLRFILKPIETCFCVVRQIYPLICSTWVERGCCCSLYRNEPITLSLVSKGEIHVYTGFCTSGGEPLMKKCAPSLWGETTHSPCTTSKKCSVKKYFYKTDFCKIRKDKKRAVFNDDQGVVVQNILRNILLPTYAKEKSNF